ncbi:hypothetical protein MY8738_006453 [Beauveria namnaoensis]
MAEPNSSSVFVLEPTCLPPDWSGRAMASAAQFPAPGRASDIKAP